MSRLNEKLVGIKVVKKVLESPCVLIFILSVVSSFLGLSTVVFVFTVNQILCGFGVIFGQPRDRTVPVRKVLVY